jgi:hypothetical protein
MTLIFPSPDGLIRKLCMVGISSSKLKLKIMLLQNSSNFGILLLVGSTSTFQPILWIQALNYITSSSAPTTSSDVAIVNLCNAFLLTSPK